MLWKEPRKKKKAILARIEILILYLFVYLFIYLFIWREKSRSILQMYIILNYYIYFLNVGPPNENIFLTTFYVLDLLYVIIILNYVHKSGFVISV